jgi:hypothetical protein
LPAFFLGCFGPHILFQDLNQMTQKYGRTFHLPASPGTTSDDKIMGDISVLAHAADLVATEKMDGENTTIHAAGCHPRSPDARYHPSRDWMKAFAAAISPRLDADERIVGEYLFARHSIAYAALPSYFLGFAWIKGDQVQGWDDTLARFAELGVHPVPVLYRGPALTGLVDRLAGDLDTTRQEGFVLRTAKGFATQDMPTHLGKYVRADHVQSDTHWMNAPIVRNGLA